MKSNLDLLQFRFVGKIEKKNGIFVAVAPLLMRGHSELAWKGEEA